MSRKSRLDATARTREKLASAHIEQHYVRIDRRGEMEDISGYVIGTGTKWVLVAVLTEGRESNGYELIRLKHVKCVTRLETREGVERRILEARGHWPLASIEVNLDKTKVLLQELTELNPVLSFHTEEKWPDMIWVGSLCRFTGKRTWYHALDPQAQWLPELECFKTRRLTRVSMGSDYVAGLVLVARPSHPSVEDHPPGSAQADGKAVASVR